MDAGALFRRRLRELVLTKYKSLDRFYLETGFSKGHLSQILRGRNSPAITTLIKLADALEVEVADFFIVPDKSDRERAIKLLRSLPPDTLRQVLREFSQK